MPPIYRVVSNYNSPFAAINTLGEATLQCRKRDLYRCIVTVGSPSFLSLQTIRTHGLFRALYESMLKKAAIVASNIQSDPAGLKRHPIFDTHVSDEKRSVSYNLGMAFAKFYSEKLLGVPNLIHIEFLKRQNAVTFIQQPGSAHHKEPDLVGQDANRNWHIFEAKGVSYSTYQLSGKIAEAKNQVQQVATIHGSQPLTGSACATYIGSDRILIHLQDPPANNGKRVDINEEAFFDSYYAPFLFPERDPEFSLRRERIDGLDVDFYDLQQAGKKLRIGLDREVAELLRNRQYVFSDRIIQKLRRYALSDSQPDRYSIGLDGFVVGYT